MGEFITFQKFKSFEDAQALISNLQKNNIEIQTTETPPELGFLGDMLHREVAVKIKQSDFDLVNQILEKQANQIQFPKDYYLYEFTDNELIEVIEKADEWSKEDFMLSQKILKDRGRKMSNEKIEKIKQKRINNLRKPEKGHIGYITIGFITAILGGILGIFIGWFYWSFKKTDPKGRQFYAYTPQTRKTGQIMFWIGLVSMIYWIYWNIKNYV